MLGVYVVGIANLIAKLKLMEAGLFGYFAEGARGHIFAFIALAFGQIPLAAAEDHKYIAIFILHYAAGCIYGLVKLVQLLLQGLRRDIFNDAAHGVKLIEMLKPETKITRECAGKQQIAGGHRMLADISARIVGEDERLVGIIDLLGVMHKRIGLANCRLWRRFGAAMSTQKQFAEKLLQIRALRINAQKPYTWASGWKSPVYCDNRMVLSHPYVRDFVKSELANMVLEHFPEAEVIAGVATAGIAHGVMAADLLKLPFIYVRSKPKEHGMGNQVEGELKAGQKVVVVEDLISTGKSSLEVVEVLRAAGAEVIGMCGLFTYGFPAADAAFAKAGVPLFTISNYGALMELAGEQKLIDAEQQASLSEWRVSPATWGR